MPLDVLKDSGNGAYLSAAWNAFITSKEGQDCLELPVLDKRYLENRLWTAFMKGADEANKGKKYLK